MRPAALAATAAAAWSAPAPAPHVAWVADALGIRRRLEPAPRREVALTFDDGPHPQGTPAVLAALERAGARATFFLVGEQVARRPALAGEIVAAGHAVALHGHSHRNLLRVGPRALAADLDRAAALIAETTGAPVRHYRAPYGVFSAGALVLARRRGWQPILWSRWGVDWRRLTTPARIAHRLTDEATARDVLLLHDADHYSAPGSWRRTAAALPRVLEALAERELHTVCL